MAKRIQLSEARLKQIIKEAVEKALEEPMETGYNEGENSIIESVKELCEREVSLVGAKTTYGFLFDKVLKLLESGEIGTVEELRERLEQYKNWARKNEMMTVASAANKILGIIE